MVASAVEAEHGFPPRAQAILLLTVGFGRSDPPKLKPLAIGEWNTVSRWLGEEGVTPESLLGEEADAILGRWTPRPRARGVTRERLIALLGRGMALAILLERWSRGGLWLVTRSEADYPKRLRERLQHRTPPVLFGCGDPTLLNAGGIAVVGSRAADEGALRFTAELGRRAAGQGLPIVSGDARGVDRTAMEAALGAGGRALGVLPGNLLRSASSRRHRGWLVAEQLALVSTFPPETRWRGWQAMDRNKHIYCLADAGVVVTSARGRSGTWAGATETLKNRWVPVWVRRSDNPGNVGLAEIGARWMPDEALDRLTALFDPEDSPESKPSPPPDKPPEPLPDRPPKPEEGAQPGSGEPATLFDAFLRHLAHRTVCAALPLDRIAEELDIQKAQTKDWIRQGVEKGQIERLVRPVRYRVSARGAKAPEGALHDDFLALMAGLADAEGLPAKDIASRLGLRPGQAQVWLRQGVTAGRLRKLGSRYTIPQPRTNRLL